MTDKDLHSTDNFSNDMRQARVLLVDDSEQDAKIFLRHCRQIVGYDWEIEHCDSFGDACAAIAAGPHDLYFLDYKLGPRNGIELIHELQKLGYGAPVILITGMDDDRIGEAALMAGATDFLPKDKLSAATIQRAAVYARIRRNAEIKLQVRAREDSLTGSYNRAHFMNLAEIEVGRSRRFRHHLSLLMLDIDHFKNINDEHGHQAGDLVIKAVVDACADNLRASDIIGRYGGDEFVILLPQTELNGANILADRIRNRVANARVSSDKKLLMSTISVGVASIPPPKIGDVFGLIRAADEALYAAKKTGRNRVRMANDDLGQA